MSVPPNNNRKIEKATIYVSFSMTCLLLAMAFKFGADMEKRAIVRRLPPLNVTYMSPVVNTLIGVESQQ